MASKIIIKQVDSAKVVIGKRAPRVDSVGDTAASSLNQIRNAPGPRNPRAALNDNNRGS